jgi:HEAT repeat protein
MPRAPLLSGRKSLLFLTLAAAVIGSAWWWQRPPPEPVYHGQRFSEWLVSDAGTSGDLTVEPLHAFGPAAVPWLAYTVEHGKHPYTKHGSLPFDGAPDWLRHRIPGRWGGLSDVSQEDERLIAARALGLLGPEAASTIPALARALSTNDEYLLERVCLTLHAIGPASWPAVREALARGKDTARIALLRTMWTRVGTRDEPEHIAEAEQVIEILSKAVHDPDAGVRAAAAHSFGGDYPISPSAPTLFDGVMPTLIQLLDDPDLRVRNEAVTAIHLFGNKGTPAVARLIALLNDPSPQVRQGTAYAFAEVDRVEKVSITGLRTLLHDPVVDCRFAALSTIKDFGLLHDVKDGDGDKATPYDAIPDLIQALSDSNGQVRWRAIYAIGDFEMQGAPAVVRLMELLDDPETNIRHAAASTLGKIDRSEHRSAERLHTMMLHDPNRGCQESAAYSLKSLGLPYDEGLLRGKPLTAQ